ncbi:MAG TPA: class I tRNA ligase family protein, partial [bacterium]|nr:class I tRNA ligase family protein [bacterium]
VKVTPSHDPQDYNIAKTHNLQFITIMDITGRMNQNAGEFSGFDRFSCREEIVLKLKEKKLIERIEPYTHRVGHCYRCDTVVEPYLSPQWFVKMKDLALPAKRVVDDKELTFYPDRWTKIYLQWLNNIQDWCISRQIWWGHRIPVWYCSNEKCPPMVSVGAPKKCCCCGGDNIVQDPDVLDTWFSSWLWPFAIFGWPEKTRDLEVFYPTDTLVTAQEIIFFWVARMVMAGFEFMKEKPFSSVYINGTVRDETGRKMSKSLGNAIDPVEIIDEVGADSLRFSLISLTSFGQDVFLPDKFYYKGRNFLNKIWNSFRYIEILVEKNQPGKISVSSVTKNTEKLDLPEKWILTLGDRTVSQVSKCLENFRFNEAADCLYDFFWHQYCDWYIEMSKMYPEKDPYLILHVIPVASYTMAKSLKLLHPFIPFITEELWHRLKNFADIEDDFITKSSWPKPDLFSFEKTVDIMEEIKKIIIEIRDIKTTFRIPINQTLEADYDGISLLANQQYKRLVEFLAGVQFKSSKDILHGISNGKSARLVRAWDTGWFSIAVNGIIEISAEKKKLLAHKEKIIKIFQENTRKLANNNFLTHAPVGVIEKTKKLCDELEAELNKIEKNLGLLDGVKNN